MAGGTRQEAQEVAAGLLTHVVDHVWTAVPHLLRELGREELDFAELRQGKFDALTHAEAVARLTGHGHPQSPDAEIDWAGEKLLSLEADRPFFVNDYPKGSRGFYDREDPGNPGVLRNFDPDRARRIRRAGQRQRAGEPVRGDRDPDAGERREPGQVRLVPGAGPGGHRTERRIRHGPAAPRPVPDRPGRAVAGQRLPEAAGGDRAVSGLRADGFPQEAVRARARAGTAEVFPPAGEYGSALFGAAPATAPDTADALDELRLVPPVFMPRRLEKLIDLGREPSYEDVDLRTGIGGFTARLPLYLSAFGSTRAAAATSAWPPPGRRHGSGSRW